MECVARELSDRQTEVSVLLPERKYKGLWHRVLHDKTGDAIQEQVSKLAHANVTSVPFHFGSRSEANAASVMVPSTPPVTTAIIGPTAATDSGHLGPDGYRLTLGATPIIEARWRHRVIVAGRVRSVRVAPLHDSPTLELVLTDSTGAISIVFLGRRAIAGIEVGTHMSAEGMVGEHKARLALLNPTYHLLS